MDGREGFLSREVEFTILLKKNQNSRFGCSVEKLKRANGAAGRPASSSGRGWGALDGAVTAAAGGRGGLQSISGQAARCAAAPGVGVGTGAGKR